MLQLILDTTSTPQTEYFQFNNHGINYHLKRQIHGKGK